MILIWKNVKPILQHIGHFVHACSMDLNIDIKLHSLNLRQFKHRIDNCDFIYYSGAEIEIFLEN